MEASAKRVAAERAATDAATEEAATEAAEDATAAAEGRRWKMGFSLKGLVLLTNKSCFCSRCAQFIVERMHCNDTGLKD